MTGPAIIIGVDIEALSSRTSVHTSVVVGIVEKSSNAASTSRNG